MQLIVIVALVLASILAWKSGWLSSQEGVTAVENIAQNIEPTVSAAAQKTHELSARKSAFARIVDNFEKGSGELENVLEDGKASLLDFKALIQDARDKDAEFNKVYSKWEAVEAKTIQVRAHFRQLVQGADDFYGAIEDRAKSIADETLRTESLAFIHESQLRYAEQLEKTQAAIASVDAMKTKVDDTMKALEIRFAVDIIDQRLGEMFAEIDSMIESVLSALKELEAESKQVLGTVGG